MYRLEYLPAARRDLVEIVQYISRELGNPAAAEALAEKLIVEGDGIPRFPYANPAYIPIKPLKYEYRKLPVHNYLMLYRINEEEKLVTVVRVVYARRNYNLLLE